MANDLLYKVALTMVPNIGAVLAKNLLEHFGDAQSVFGASIKQLATVESMGEVNARSIIKFEDYTLAEQELNFIHKYNIQPLFITDKAYPQKLLNCFDAPTLLYYKGSADLNASKVISIIGTRSNTDYGKQITDALVEGLKDYNPLIVSGLAFGIDALAHKAAIQNNLSTVGVLAHGLHTIYPAQHKEMAKEMIENGGILSEFTSGVKADKHNFPRRNRIVAGMADATIVIETALRGGSMITAELANNYNRDVFAVPGKVNDSKSAGCNYLIKNNKAILLTDAQQLIEEMHWDTTVVKKKQQRELFIEVTPEEQKIIDILKEKDAVHIDELYLRSGLSSSSVAGALLGLELQNVVLSMPGKRYKLV